MLIKDRLESSVMDVTNEMELQLWTGCNEAQKHLSQEREEDITTYKERQSKRRRDGYTKREISSIHVILRSEFNPLQFPPSRPGFSSFSSEFKKLTILA